jgi:uncharacterized membrane protein YjgN (DUF898 family)
MKKRSIPLSVFLSIITLGIYALIWFYGISKETIEELEYEAVDSPGLNLLYLFLTMGIYVLWWNYKISTYLNTIEKRHNIEPDFWATPMSLFFMVILHQARMNRICATKKKM